MQGDETFILGAPEPVIEDKAPLWPVVLVVIAVVAAGVLTWRSGPDEPTEAQNAQQEVIESKQAAQNLEGTLPPAATPTTIAVRPVSPPLSERVPGFEDVIIVALSDASGGPAYHLVWAPTANSGSRVSTMDNAEFDTSGEYFARLEGSTWNRVLLGVGQLSAQATGPLAIGAESFTWHASAPNMIAWVAELEAGRRALFTADVTRENGDGVALISYVQDLGQADLLAWDHWGFALQNPGELWLMGTDGADLQRISGATFLGSAGDESVMVRVGDQTVVTDVRGVTSEEPTWVSEIPGRIIGLHPSPDNSVFLVTSIDRDTVLNYEVHSPGGLVVELDEQFDNALFQSWSTDGLFALFSTSGEGGSSVLFHNTTTFDWYSLELPDAVLSVDTRG